MWNNIMYTSGVKFEFVLNRFARLEKYELRYDFRAVENEKVSFCIIFNIDAFFDVENFNYSKPIVWNIF